jgi:type IX secretion system PorP/SprF family membrane protein
MLKNLLFVVFFCWGSLVSVVAQEDISYNHILSVSTYYNPSFAGTSGAGSFSGNFKTGDISPHHADMNSVCMSFDKYFSRVQGGLGLISYYNFSPNKNISANYLGLIYAPKFRLNDYFTFSPSMKAGFISNTGNVTYQCPSDTATFRVTRRSSDFALGVLLNSANLYAGMSVDHIFEPKINFAYYDTIPLYRKYQLQFGYHYEGSENGRSFVHFNTLYQIQKNNNFIFISNYYVGKKYEYLLGENEYFCRLMLGVGYKMINPKILDFSDNTFFLGFGVQTYSMTLGAGIELPSFSIQPSTVEASVKYTFK